MNTKRDIFTELVYEMTCVVVAGDCRRLQAYTLWTVCNCAMLRVLMLWPEPLFVDFVFLCPAQHSSALLVLYKFLFKVNLHRTVN